MKLVIENTTKAPLQVGGLVLEPGEKDLDAKQCKACVKCTPILRREKAKAKRSADKLKGKTPAQVKAEIKVLEDQVAALTK